MKFTGSLKYDTLVIVGEFDATSNDASKCNLSETL